MHFVRQRWPGWRHAKEVFQWLIFLPCLTCVLLTEHQYDHRLPIENQIPAEELKFSPGGSHFYRTYIHRHRPVVIKDAAKRWPLLTKWNDRTDENEQFMSQVLPVGGEQSTSSETIRNVIEKQLKVNTILPKDGKLLEEINLPFILQCQEYVDKLIDVHLHINSATSQRILFSSEEKIIVAFDKPVSVLLFETNQTLSGESIKDVDVDMTNIDVEKYPHVADIPYQYIELLAGDLLYIPKYTWYHIGSSSALNFVSITFDFHRYDWDRELHYTDALKEYTKFLSSTPNSLKCNNAKSNFHTSLNKENDFEAPGLRLPKKNKRPDDILLASGYKMPVLGLGTDSLNEATYDAVKYALDEEGYRMFDLAHAYPVSEYSFAKALSESSVPREKVFIVTKVEPRYLGYNETSFAIQDSLERLNTSYIDLYLIHAIKCNDLLKCGENEPKGTWKESWRAMEHAVKIGKIRSIGVSNFGNAEIYELLKWAEEPVSVIQNWFDPFNQDKEARKICSEHNIRYMGYSTLGNYWVKLGAGFNPVLTSTMVIGISNSYDYVVSSVVLRWAIHENVTVIPRSSNPKHIGQNIRALDLSLRQAEIDMINSFSMWMDEVTSNDSKTVSEDISNWIKDSTTKS